MPILVAAAVVVGLAIGSFLNVVIWRVPRDESVSRPREPLPVLRQRRCGPMTTCRWSAGSPCAADAATVGEPISVRYPLVEAGTGLLFGVTAWYLGLSWALPAFLYLVAIGVALALIDLDVHRLPNKIVLPSYVVMTVLLVLASVGTGDWAALLRAAIGGVALYVLYFVLMFAYPKGMGFGDVKLAGILGMYLGWLGWGQLVVGGFLGFLLGGLVGGGPDGRQAARPASHGFRSGRS